MCADCLRRAPHLRANFGVWLGEKERKEHRHEVLVRVFSRDFWLQPVGTSQSYSPLWLHGRVDSVCGFHSTDPGSIPNQGTCMPTEPDAC